MPDTTWVVVTDAARCRVFATEPDLSTFDEVSDLVHPASRLRTGDLVTDARGAHRSGSGPRSGPSHGQSPHDAEEQAFANHVAEFLDVAAREGRYDDLVVVAAPRFLGMLRPELSSRVVALVSVELAKDYTTHSAADLQAHIRKALGDRPLLG